MVDSDAFHINTVLQSVSYQSLEKGMIPANTYDSDSYPVDRYLGVFSRVERRLWFRLRRARSHESAYE